MKTSFALLFDQGRAMSYTIIAKYPPNRSGAVWWHIKVEDAYYIVSANTVPYSGPETYIFKSDEDATFNGGDTVVEYRGTLDHKLAIAELFKVLAEESEEEDEETSNTISERDAHQRFDEFLDEIHGTVKCGELEWDMSRVLKEMDPTAYRCGLNDWLDAEGLELE